MFSGTASPLATKEKKSMRKAASKYLREVKKNLRCPYSLRAEFLNQLADEVYLYCDEHEGEDLVSLSKRFGNPEAVAEDFLNSLDGNAVAKSELYSGRVLLVAIAILIVLAMAVGIHRIYVQRRILDSKYIESITFEEDHIIEITGPTFFHEEGSAN